MFLGKASQEEVEVLGPVYVFKGPSASQAVVLIDSERKLRSTLCLDELAENYLTGAL